MNQNNNNTQLINGLNEDLAGELGTIIRYTIQSSKAHGPQGLELRKMLSAEIQDELEHASFLADVIVDLGGDPTTTAQPFAASASLRETLELDIRLEEQDVVNYRQRASMAGEQDNIELKVRLEEMAADEARHARELRRLVRGM